MDSFVNKILPGFNDGQKLGKSLLNGLGVLTAVFGATVLVPIILGIDAAPVLLALGIGSIIAIILTKGEVPYFLSSSFAFIAAATWSLSSFGQAVTAGSIILSSVPYFILAIIIKFVGPNFLKKIFSPVILGSTVLAIATSLMPTAISSATQLNGEYSLAAILISLIILAIIIVAQFVLKLPSVAVLIGIGAGYIICLIVDATGLLGDVTLINFTTQDFFVNPLASWPGIEFNPSSFIPFMLLSLSTMSEHLSDIAAIGSVTGKDYYQTPGLQRTLTADGIGNLISGLFGNPVTSTTYGENTGWVAISKEYSTKNQFVAGIYLILLSFLGLFSAFLGSIPSVVIGAVSIVLYGLIAAAGLGLMVRAKVDFNQARNLIICSVVLSIAIGGFVLKIGEGDQAFELSSIACGTLIGIILHLILPPEKPSEEKVIEP